MKLADNPKGAPPGYRESFTAVLMAGGQSRRMGRDKALLEIGGKPLWERQLEVLRELSPAALWISGRAYGSARVIPDAWPDCGPLGGLASVLAQAETPWVVVLAVDLPLMTPCFLRVLLDEATASGKGVAPWDGGRFHPLAAVYPQAAAEVLRGRVTRGELAMQAAVNELEERGLIQRRPLAARERRWLENINEPGDWARLLRI